jgi:hypothetical protein
MMVAPPGFVPGVFVANFNVSNDMDDRGKAVIAKGVRIHS